MQDTRRICEMQSDGISSIPFNRGEKLGRRQIDISVRELR